MPGGFYKRPYGGQTDVAHSDRSVPFLVATGPAHRPRETARARTVEPRQDAGRRPSRRARGAPPGGARARSGRPRAAAGRDRGGVHGRRPRRRTGPLGGLLLRPGAGGPRRLRHLPRRSGRRGTGARLGDRGLPGAAAPLRARSTGRAGALRGGRGGGRKPPAETDEPTELTGSHTRSHRFSAKFSFSAIPWRNGPPPRAPRGPKAPPQGLTPSAYGAFAAVALPSGAAGRNASPSIASRQVALSTICRMENLSRRCHGTQ